MDKKEIGTISVDREPEDRFSKAGTSRDAAAAMSEEQIREAALSDPDSVPVPVYDTPGLIHQVNVKKLREQLGMTQEAFAEAFRIPVGTLRDWEQRRKIPDAPARAYLTVIARDPQAVAELLRPAA